MFMYELAGAHYERRSYDKVSTFVGRQILEVGRIDDDPKNPESVILLVNIESYDDDGRLKNKHQLTWRCARSAVGMIMSAFVFAGDSQHVDMRLEARGQPLTYPDHRGEQDRLQDVSINLKITKGTRAFFGARSEIRFTNRMIEIVDAAEDEGPGNYRYSMTSDVLLKAYVLGIRLKRKRFRSEELIDHDHGLLRQVPRFKNGSYSVMERLGPHL